MAENTIDNLSIQVVASAERVISTFNRLASGASGLRGAARGAAGAMQDMAQGARDAGTATQEAGTQSGKARPNIKGVGKDAKDAGENAKKGSSGLATFWQSLKRIAYYRMIRSIIKGIGQAFREGAQNMYQWSSANPSLSDFAKNMNRIATSVLYLKNSLGALLEPIVRILTPVIEWVIDKLVWLIDKVNQFFAALSGAETYTAAKKVATTWGDAADDVASSTHKAAEDIRRTLLGFDEINRLDKPNSGSYGGGGGTPSMSAAAQDMFEERPLEGWAKAISDFIRRIKDFFDGIFGPIKQLFTDAGSAFDDLNRSLDAAQQEDKTVNINVKINTTAEKLWNDFVDEWNAIKDKILFFKISPTPPVDLLWNQIKNAWDSVDHTLGFLIETASSANGHWKYFKNDWDKEDHTVGFVIKSASSANGHWDVFKKAWDKEDRTVGFLIKTASSAKGHWDNFKKDWDNLESNTVGFLIKTASSANGHWNVFKKEWDAGDRKVGFTIKTASTADGHWSVFKKAWDAGDRIVGFIIKTASSANGHWDTFKKAWVAEDRKVGFIITTASSANGHWDVFKKEWVDGNRKVGFIITTASTANGHWDTFKKEWDAGDRTVYVDVQLKKKDWTTVTDFVDDSFGGATGGGGKTSGGGAGRTYSITADVVKGNAWASTIGGTITYLGLNDLTTSITTSLKKVSEWKTQGIGKYLDITTQTPKVNVDLNKKWGKKTPVDYLGLSGLSTTIKVGLRADGSKLKLRVSKGEATIQSATKRTENVEQTKALGGVFSNGRWSNIPQYANGTLNAGTIFAAGEAGPEVVGHVGGRTEVLNKSQLASAMFSAVQAAMAPAAANFASAAQSMGVANVSFDFETLAEMVRQGVEQAMARSNDYDRQKVALLQQINEKDYNPEISTSSINKAQQRMNRRAGTTIVPVGT